MTMSKINTLAELHALKEVAKAQMEGYEQQILICGGTGCTSSGSIDLYKELVRQVNETGLADKVAVIKTGCFGLCALGPIMITQPDGCFYAHLKMENIERIIDQHIIGGNPIRELLYEETVQGEGILKYTETPFYSAQERVVLRNCGVIAPDNIEHYIARDGYQALAKALLTMSADEILKELEISGLKGRGGAGFPTHLKWKFTRAAKGDQKYVCCNADEGDPGAFMNRSVLEGDPHSVLEAMTIAGFVVGSNQGYIYVRAEYPIAVEHLTIAIEQARELGLLGKNILGTGFDFDIELRLGAGAFVCGEETALMRSIEGKRGEPRVRPPFPANQGLFEKPTLLNNVETYSVIPQILTKGGEWYAQYGPEGARGTKVFALGGKINHTGLAEIPMGTTLRTVVEEIGGGIPGGKKFKAAQAGGPSGGCIPASLIDTPIEYASLKAVGSIVGSGGLIIMDEETCMVDIAKFFLEFTIDESCGKCTACRIGMKRLLEILDKITSGNGEMEDLDRLEELAAHIQSSSLCALGQTAPNPVLSTLRYFRDEYIAHIVDKKCPAGVCKALLQYFIEPDKCKGCTLCSRVCPAGAISGTVRNPHTIDTAKCLKCGACIEKCKFGAIIKK
ncbi:MAG: NADH-quinone oxidoreductase subunit NuoF [Christensenellaceae bacterium]|nr:NADH-quinone oxidoreductase subunit NuoF [Christensenellaceae bacterium]